MSFEQGDGVSTKPTTGVLGSGTGDDHGASAAAHAPSSSALGWPSASITAIAIAVRFRRDVARRRSDCTDEVSNRVGEELRRRLTCARPLPHPRPPRWRARVSHHRCREPELRAQHREPGLRLGAHLRPLDLEHPRVHRGAHLRTVELGHALRSGEADVDLLAHLLEGRDVVTDRRRELRHRLVHGLLHLRLVERREELLLLGELLLQRRRVLA